MARTVAVFFDVDFTLIRPGPRFQATGYHESCGRHGITVDPAAYDAAVAGAASVLDSADALYNPAIFVRYTRRIIELMGGTGPHVDAAAQELYDEWAHHHHFSLYDDVPDALAATWATLLSLAQRRLSHTARRLRRETADVEGRLVLEDGTDEPLTRATLLDAPEAALRLLTASTVVLAAGLVALRV